MKIHAAPHRRCRVATSLHEAAATSQARPAAAGRAGDNRSPDRDL